MKIPHTPDDILEATLLFSNGMTKDITELAEVLIGPFLNQINKSNKEWIIEYLEKKHSLKNIDKIEITFINNNKIIVLKINFIIIYNNETTLHRKPN